jgi:hypothetical protein
VSIKIFVFYCIRALELFCCYSFHQSVTRFIDFRNKPAGPERSYSHEIRPDLLCTVESVNVLNGLVRIIGEFENGVIVF